MSYVFHCALLLLVQSGFNSTTPMAGMKSCATWHNNRWSICDTLSGTCLTKEEDQSNCACPAHRTCSIHQHPRHLNSWDILHCCKICIYNIIIYPHMHTHTHTHIYLFIYIYTHYDTLHCVTCISKYSQLYCPSTTCFQLHMPWWGREPLTSVDLGQGHRTNDGRCLAHWGSRCLASMKLKAADWAIRTVP